MRKRPPHQVSIRADVHDALKARIALLPKHERHGALSRLVTQPIETALDAKESA